MVTRVDVAPAVLSWATERSGRPLDALQRRFRGLSEWLQGDTQPTLKQLEAFARATYTPVGLLLLSEPPVERVPVPDYRTIADRGVPRASADLLDTIYLCEQRQDWYRDYQRVHGAEPVAFVGSAQVTERAEDAAIRLREQMQFDVEDRSQIPSWTEALRAFVEHVEHLGALVMISGIVGSNTHRKLDPAEFRAFALVDAYAPVVFVNGADAKAAQIFSLAHELGHICLGESSVSNASLDSRAAHGTERWCNAFAAELLVPAASLRSQLDVVSRDSLPSHLRRLSRHYKVSTLVVLRRIHDLDLIDWAAYHEAYDEELRRVRSATSSGGDFYRTLPVRASRRFTEAMVADALEGRTLYRDAFQLLGIRSQRTFDGLVDRLLPA